MCTSPSHWAYSYVHVFYRVTAIVKHNFLFGYKNNSLKLDLKLTKQLLFFIKKNYITLSVLESRYLEGRQDKNCTQ